MMRVKMLNAGSAAATRADFRIVHVPLWVTYSLCAVFNL